MGCAYTGGNARRRINGSLKIGIVWSKDTPSARHQNLRQSEPSWEPYDTYIQMPNATKAECEIVESYARMMVERTFPECKNVGNDHFDFPIVGNKNEQEANYFAHIIQFYVDACELFHISYKVIQKAYKRRY